MAQSIPNGFIMCNANFNIRIYYFLAFFFYLVFFILSVISIK